MSTDYDPGAPLPTGIDDSIHPIVAILLYGDIDEVPLRVLKSHCPSFEKFKTMDDEQKTRLAAAAFIQQWFDNGGFLQQILNK